jgi:hypothetical protein
MKKHLIVLSVMIAAVCLSMGKRDRKKDLNSTVSRVSELSLQQLNSLDSFLAEYPNTFTTAATRSGKRNTRSLLIILKERSIWWFILNPVFIMKS